MKRYPVILAASLMGLCLMCFMASGEVTVESRDIAAGELSQELRNRGIMNDNCELVYEGADMAEGEALWHFRLEEKFPEHIAVIGYYYVSSEGQMYTYDIANDTVTELETQRGNEHEEMR
ncbi:MAG: hypothetical protein IJG65_06190 [Synergistaceae bacterium]|nr:hypothetical protein [Synergistaceae bacterium]